jgi:hypothetical protein
MARLYWTKAIDVVGIAGQFWIFAIGADATMVYKYWDGAAWQPSLTGWSSLGGSFISAPSAVARNFTSDPTQAQIDVVAVGSVRGPGGQQQRAVLHRAWNGAAWEPQSGWEEVGPLANGPFMRRGSSIWAEPAAITGVTGPHTLDVVAVDRFGQVLHRYLAGGAWQPAAGWESLGAGANSAPALAGLDSATHKLNVFVVNAAGAIVHQYWDGTAWNPSQTTWEDLGGPPVGVFDTVAAAGTNDVRFDVCGGDVAHFGQLQTKTYFQSNPAAWLPLNAWTPVAAGGGIYPVIVESGTPLDRVDLIATGSEVMHCFQAEYPSNSGYSAWESLGGGLVASDMVPAAAADCVYPAPLQAQLHIAYLGRSGMQHKYYDQGGWHPSMAGWDQIGNGINNAGFLWNNPTIL